MFALVGAAPKMMGGLSKVNYLHTILSHEAFEGEFFYIERIGMPLV